MNNKIYSLQYLRAFAALWVLLTHVLQELGIRPNGVLFAGQWGVDIFFLLSGFIIYLTTRDHSSWKAFAIKRVFRIYPAYWLCLIIYISYSAIYNRGGYNCLNIIQNVLMIPFSEPIGYSSLIVGQAWSTCYEMYFYFLLAALLVFGFSKKWLLPLILILFFLGYALSRFLPMDGFVGYIYSLIGKHHVLFFCEGIIIARFHEWIRDFKIKKSLLIVISIISLLFYCFILCQQYGFVISFLASPLFFIIVYKANEILPEKGMVNKVMVTLGDISFSIYLIHLVVIRFLLNQFGIDDFVLLLCTSLILTLAFSLLSYYMIEKRFMDLGKKLSAHLR
ncbi:MAG: acyltransferase [Lachnospiraceae bacterium]|nr:acyltransferase [Lachnospiraceae bacterium]